MQVRSTGLAVSVVLLTAGCTSTTGSVPSPSSTASDRTPNVVPTTSSPVPPATRVTVSSPPRGSVLVRGEYPHVDSPCRRHRQPVLRARYPGSLTVSRAKDGTLTVLVRLPFERYLEGIAEVPSSWPSAALDAQAIAARSYALATTGWTGQGDTLDSPICSSTSCQVYRGIPVPAQPGIGRWYAAVRRTAGKLLLYQGRPADAVYFSTSNGRTYGNEDVFGSSPLPYLRPVIERDDGASPESHWRVVLAYRDLGPILAAADLWPKGRAVRRVAPIGDSFEVAGDATTRSIGMSDFRNAVNTWAPCLLPGRYPTDSRYGSPLPLTVPSGWFTPASGAAALTLTGRGWGHGAGMVQWGAYGKARRGLSAAQILGFYYGGLEPQAFPEPGKIDVEVASGLTSLTLLGSAGGARLNGERLPRGPVTIDGGDRLEIVRG